jgi:hypothetical protein
LLYALLRIVPVQEYQQLVAQFKRQEQQLYQFCEEKVTLAHHAADLIQQHQKELESVSMLAGGSRSMIWVTWFLT